MFFINNRANSRSPSLDSFALSNHAEAALSARKHYTVQDPRELLEDCGFGLVTRFSAEAAIEFAQRRVVHSRDLSPEAGDFLAALAGSESLVSCDNQAVVSELRLWLKKNAPRAFVVRPDLSRPSDYRLIGVASDNLRKYLRRHRAGAFS